MARIALALGALALVGGAVALLLWFAAPAAPPPPARNPFGTGMREAAPSASGWGALILGWQAAFYTSLRGALSTLRTSGTGFPALVAVGFAYGVFHAAGPGHGKAVIASYIVSSEHALRRGLAVSAAAALIQALIAIALVALIFLALGGTAAAMGRAVTGVEMAGFGLIAALGLVLLWRKAGKLQAIADANVAGQGPVDCACGPVDPAATANGSVRQMAAVAIGAGIRPCAGAIVVLTFGLSQGMFAAGIAAVLAMAAGTALTTSALASLSVYAKRAALRLASGRGRAGLYAGAALELLAAALVAVIGVALLFGVWDGPGGA